MHTTPLANLINLSGKTALVTGGAQGIGLGISRRLAEAGASVVVADINDDLGNAAVADLNKNGFQASFAHLDVLEEVESKHLIDEMDTLSILVNNAGVYPSTPILDMSSEEFEKVIQTNLKSVFQLTRAAAQRMIREKTEGSIINITSIDALHPSSVGLAAYDASKHGVWGFTKNVALELAPHNIRVNAIAPGGIATPGTGAGADIEPDMKETIETFLKKIPMGRMGDPDEIGRVALFLASDLSAYMTGSQVVVDGGVLLS